MIKVIFSFLYLFESIVSASTSTECVAIDGNLEMSRHYDSSGCKFEVTFDGARVPGTIRLCKKTNDVFVLELEDQKKQIFSLHAKKTGEEFSYKVEKGFVFLKGQRKDLRGVVFSCTSG